ncbi:MAG TPA: Na+/H+ antiporter [Candidatus Methylomirabilis sp.]|nr:Na+/H+ antiporter [Candidatus Methylomirabilis sp.]
MTTSFAVEFLIAILIVAAVIAVLAERLRIPYTAALVLGGLLLGSLHPMHLPFIDTLITERPQWLTPNVTLVIFLPPLLFEGSLKIQFRELRAGLWPMLLLATVGVVLTTAATALAVHWATALPLSVALVFGAIVAATDPISVLAIFKTMTVAKRLSTIVEGESLFNDGTAAVLFKILVAGVATGTLSIRSGVPEFLVVVLGGAAVGAILGFLVSKIVERLDDPQVEITLTTIVAYGAYLAADSLQLSGVIATVAGGLVVGNVGARHGMSPRTRIALWSFWEYAAFVINSIVFLLIGLQVRVGDLRAGAPSILVAIVAVLIGRMVCVYLLVPLSNAFSPAVSLRWRHVLVLAGLRGALSLTLALSLESRFPHRSEILAMTFGVVAFTIVAQGLSLKPILRRLGITGSADGEFERARVRQMALTAARSELEELRERTAVSAPAYERLRRELDTEARETENTIARLFEQDEARFAAELRFARTSMLAAQRSAIEQAMHDGIISAQTASRMIGAADRRLEVTMREEERENPAES